jgi:hypothetical protein
MNAKMQIGLSENYPVYGGWGFEINGDSTEAVAPEFAKL